MFWLFYVIFEKRRKLSVYNGQIAYENADSTFAQIQLYFYSDNQMVAEMR